MKIYNGAKYYENEQAQKQYKDAVDKVGLWGSEKIVFEEFVGRDKKILDVGCGAGRTTFGLYKLGYKNIVGVDLCEDFIKFAKNYAKNNNFNINFQTEDATKLNFPEHSFDVVFFSFNGLMCIPGEENRINAVKNVYKILKPNGLFIFTTHSREDEQFLDYWKEEQEKWNIGVQDDSLIDFGDRIKQNDKNGYTFFIHIPSNIEVYNLLSNNGFAIIYNKARNEIVVENQAVQDFSSNCIFYVARKNETN